MSDPIGVGLGLSEAVVGPVVGADRLVRVTHPTDRAPGFELVGQAVTNGLAGLVELHVDPLDRDQVGSVVTTRFAPVVHPRNGSGAPPF